MVDFLRTKLCYTCFNRYDPEKDSSHEERCNARKEGAKQGVMRD